jgi:hypothetical protein
MGQGSGAYFNQANALVQNCTITRNASVNTGGGIERVGTNPSRVDNCVIWENQAPTGSELYNGADGALIVSHSDVHGGANATRGVISDGGGNFESQPFPDAIRTANWTGSAQYDADSYQSHLSDSNANWLAGALKGMYVQVDTNSTLQYFIVSNTVDSLALWGDFSDQVLDGKKYIIHDYRLPQDSDCVDRGTNIVEVTEDLEMIPRPLDGDGSAHAEWDVGAYEYVSPTSDTDMDGLSDAIEIGTYGTDPTRADTDGDLMNDGDELAADVDPTDPDSLLAITALYVGVEGQDISWTGGSGAVLVLEYKTNLFDLAEAWKPAVTAMPPLSTTEHRTVNVSNSPAFFRIRVGE